MSDKTKHIVGFSGGIDSQACARWVLNRYPKEDVILTNSDAGGNEHPLTSLFIEEYGSTVHPVTSVNAIYADLWKTEGFAETRGFESTAPLSFGDLIAVKGRAPSIKAQFCTEVLKLRPMKRWLAEKFGPAGQWTGWEYIIYIGVRRDESRKRAEQPFAFWNEWYDCEQRAPIADWTKKMCFEYVDHHKEPVNPLYTMGFARVGCAPCINSNKEDLLNWAIRFPAMIDKVRGWEERTGRAFFGPSVPGKSIAFVDEIVEWAKTSRGGRQQPLPIFHEREACESKYGLCE
jgi:3'-phosphoadenosine 5'-phosphosulfate sulfotransferase (PAPS reductase)/FAD synthetase